jgi:hypothetical protein
MILEQRLNSLAAAIAVDVKALRLADGTLSSLSTANKTNLVAAINEVLSIAQDGAGVILDTAGNGDTAKTWSADKIYDHVLASIDSLRTELTNGASAALDTFGEIAAQLSADQSSAAALATAVANRVRFDAAQTLDATQKATARTNIDAASQADLSALTTAVGNTDQNLVAAYVAARDA